MPDFIVPIIIAGAGFLGSYVAREFLERGETVVLYEISPDYAAIKSVCNRGVEIVEGDILDSDRLQTLVDDYKPKDIVHTAVVRQRMAQEKPERARLVNIDGTKHIIRIAERAGARLVYPSSASVYGNKVETDKPIKENYPLNPESVYAQTKVECEKLIIGYSDSIILRFPSLFGPWKGDTSTGNGIFRRLIESALLGRSIVIDNPFPGHSEQLYIKDATNAVVLASNARRLKHRVFNIGSGRMNSYEEALEIIRKILPEVNIELRNIESVVDTRNQPLNITLAREELGYTPQFDFKSAIRDYIDVMKKYELIKTHSHRFLTE